MASRLPNISAQLGSITLPSIPIPGLNLDLEGTKDDIAEGADQLQTLLDDGEQRWRW